MSLTETLFVIAAILVVVDFFIASDTPTHVAYVIICFNVVRLIDSPFLYRVLFGLILWFILVAFHYVVWRKVVLRFTNKYIAPDIHIDGARGRIGMKGTVRSKDGNVLVSVQGDLWHVQSESNETLNEGDSIEVVGEKDGVLIVRSK